MSLLPLLLVLAATPSESASAAPREGVLVYEGPVDVTAAPSTYGFTTYAKGDTSFVAVDEANLRGSASLDAPVVRTLRLGSVLQVLEVASGTVLVKDRVDRWYRVRTSEAEPQEGFVLGNVLTPLAATRDLDGDGQEERLAVSFTSDFMVRVRVVEPELAARKKRAVAALDFLLPEAAAGRRGGRARLVPVSAKELGMEPSPRAFGLELCATSCVVHAVAYEAKKGVVGTLSVPPEVRAGVTLYAKPRKLLSIYIKGEDEIPDERITCSLIGKVRGGTYDQKEVLTCADEGNSKIGPPSRSAYHYLMLGGAQLLRPGSQEGYATGMDAHLKSEGYNVRLEPNTLLPGLTPPEELYADARGRIRLRFRSPDKYVRSAVEVAFVHPTLGTVTMTRPGAKGLEEGNPLGFNGFYVPEPAGGFLFYAYERDFSAKEVTWKEPRPEGVSYSLQYDLGCGRVRAVNPAPADVRAADLVEVGQVKGAGPIFTLKDSEHPDVERTWKEFHDFPPTHPSYVSKEGFFESSPPLFWWDSFGRLLRVLPTDLSVPCMEEPIVYFYPERPMHVRYTLAPEVRVARAEPLARDNAWTFLATPQGLLEEVDAAPGRARRTFKRLFWEGTSVRFPPPAEGVCLPGSRTSEYFREVLPRLGLQPHETEDFLEAWVPRMEGAAFNVIGFHPREVVDRLAPVRVSPAPTWMIRILMDATPVEECPELQAPVLPEAMPAREGFSVVEWGGVLRENR
ncbi:SH3 domain-containing protein [Archangium lipolyticum]|uniref:SH3 domain-containing protein n=1 Tax=Archangium lipolyticum TaxID=2970465 RepID=UPI00214A1AB5|nr:SH3 domain-containing protein [Archangium lipolyticum]